MSELSPFDEGYVAPPPKPAPEPKPAPAPRATRARAEAKPFPDAASRAEADAEDEVEPEIEYPTTIADGVYFGMIDDAYHAIERLSASGMQNLMVSPATFWARSWLNRERVEKPIKARIVGRAYHAARLEPDLFAANYVRALDKTEMPNGTLFTGADMGAKLADLGLAKSGSVAEQAERLVANGYRGPVWHVELARWKEAHGKRIPLPAVTFDEIAEDGKRLRSVPAVAELLSGGAAEVSVFWTCPKTGIPMKARLDYLKPAAWADLKTFDNTRGKRLEQAIADAFRFNRYYVQAVAYRDAVEAIRNGWVDLVGAASEGERKILAQIQMRPTPLDCWYVFQEKGGVPNILARRFRFDDLPASHDANKAGLSADDEARVTASIARPSAIARKASVEISHAKRLYLGYSEIYEPGEPWIPFDPLADIGDDDFPPKWLEGVYE